MSNQVDFSEQIADFRAADEGEDVRGSLIDIAEAVQGAVNGIDDALTGAIGAQLYTVDPSLTTSGAGADAKITGDKIAVINNGNRTLWTELLPRYNYAAELSFTDGKAVSSANGGLITSEYWSASDYMDVSGISRLIYPRLNVHASSQPNIGLAFYTSEKAFISSQKVKYTTDGDTTVEETQIAVPQNAVYARFTYLLSTGELIGSNPFYVYDAGQSEQSVKTRVDRLETAAAALADEADRIDAIIEPFNLANNAIFTDNVAINSINGQAIVSEYWSASDYIEITGVSRLEYPRIVSIASSAINVGVAFYTSTKTFVSSQRLGYGAAALRVDRYYVDVPDTAVYARFTYLLSSSALILNNPFYLYDAAQASASIKARVDALEGVRLSLHLHETPDNEGVTNVIKRCRQMTDIRWTPAADLPRLMLVQRTSPIPEGAEEEEYEGIFKAGTEYTGVPYGRCSNTMTAYGYSYSYVGLNVDFGTFVTAVQNANSNVCKDSAYYHPDHITVPYGAICNALVCYALAVPFVATGAVKNIAGLNRIGLVNDNGTRLSNIKLGDILIKGSYHVAVITDIIRDASGNITAVEISDASTAGLADRNFDDGPVGGLCRRRGWTAEQFYAADSWGGFDVYRYAGIANVTYTPSPYVNVGDELDTHRIEHYPVMPYEGNGFVYHSGAIPGNAVKLIVSQPRAPRSNGNGEISAYTHICVLKDGSLLSGYPVAIDAEDTDYEVEELTAGTYTAYLCTLDNGSVKYATAACSWSIV